MLDWAKILHEAIGIQSPRVFIAAFALFGFVAFGAIGFFVDRGYRVKLQQDARAQQNVAPASATAPIAEVPQRQFLPPDIDFKYLTGLYRENTWLQADGLAKNYIGKWMKQSVIVENVVESPTLGNRSGFNVLASIEHPPKNFAVESLKFGADWKDRVSVLKRGSKITFVGKIDGLDSSSITFRDCELVD
jgi:hypothetical protein